MDKEEISPTGHHRRSKSDPTHDAPPCAAPFTHTIYKTPNLPCTVSTWLAALAITIGATATTAMCLYIRLIHLSA